MRSDYEDTRRLLGDVGLKFKPLQNQQAFNFCGPLVDKGLQFQTSGVLRGGRVVWMMVKLPWTAEVGPDTIVSYLVIRNAHDGSGSLEAMFLPVNSIGQNVLAISPTPKPQKIRLRHTSGGESKLTSAYTIFDQAEGWWDTNIDVMRQLRGVNVLDGVLAEFLFLLLPNKRGREDALAAGSRAWIHERFARLKTNTAYDLWNLVTQFLDHVPTQKRHRGSRLEARMTSLLWGARATLRAEAGALLLKMFK